MEPLPPPLAAPVAAVPSAAPGWTPTRLGVFGRVLWRAALTCIGGGAVVGLVIGVGIAIAATDDTTGERVAAPFIVAYVAAAFGLLLAIVAAPIVAGLCCARMVPYPGRESVVRTARLIGTGFIAVVSILIVVSVGTGWQAWAGIGVLSTIGAWFLSPLLVRWYVRRMPDPS